MNRFRTLLVFLSLTCFQLCGAGKPVELRLTTWTAILEPETLSVRARMQSEREEIFLASGPQNSVEGLISTAQSARWKIPDLGLTVTFDVQGNRLRARLESAREQTFEWPRTGLDPRFTALILPEGEGLYIPFNNPTWREKLSRQCFSASGQLSMPFWSYQLAAHTVTYHAISDIRTELCLVTDGGRLAATAKHAFLNRDRFPPYEIEMWPGGASPIAPALEYREELIRTHQFRPLTEKLKENPNIQKLFGAVHMYVWGDGRTTAFLDDLQRLQIHRAWIGYDQEPRAHKNLVDKPYITAAKAAGYLVGPYDTFSNAQDPVNGEDSVSRWPSDLYPAGCVVDSNGKRHEGFAGRGCELSSEALERALSQSHPLDARMDDRLRDGANSYFLDVDAFGDLYDDYSPAHPMTPFKDRENRLRRMQALRERGLVLGSEEGVGWSVPVIDFAHGALSVQNAVLWGNKKKFGAWWPSERPQIFFRPVETGPEFAEAKYDPAHRLPLYEAAFHASVVATDRWDLPLSKFSSLMKVRQLIEILYGVPSMWAMDRRQLSDSAATLTKLVAFFHPLHQQIATLPLTNFEWLTPDRQVQRTTFGTEVAITVNFNSPAYTGVKIGCAAVESIPTHKISTFCP